MRKQPVALHTVIAISILSFQSACREARSARPSGTAAGAPPGEALVEAAFGTDKENAFRHPVWFGEVPGKAGVYLVLERGGGKQDGRIHVLKEQGGKWVRQLFLALPVQSTAAYSDERGLLGLAFHPRFAENRRYFLYYMPVRDEAGNDSTVIVERRADASLLADAGGKGRRVLGIAQPYANHNGGTLAFGPKDGFLYIGTGDGGAAGDPQGHGQNLGSLLGKMLRIDVDDTAGGRAYGIPRDNPFLGAAPGPGEGGQARPEVWAYGLRNPWKWSFDAVTGDLWAGDVGQNTREEITKVGRGQNLGWKRMEGFACFEPPSDCGRKDLTPPLVDLERNEARSITGGHVFRADPASPFHGAYIFGDWETRLWWALLPGHKPGDRPVPLGRLPDQPSSFGVDAKGNIFAVGYRKGIIYRLSFPVSAGRNR